MFTLTVRDHMMIAHSLPDPFFGPAQNLHGATYEVETTWSRPVLDEHGVVMDIGMAGDLLAGVLDGLRADFRTAGADQRVDRIRGVAGRRVDPDRRGARGPGAPELDPHRRAPARHDVLPVGAAGGRPGGRRARRQPGGEGVRRSTGW